MSTEDAIAAIAMMGSGALPNLPGFGIASRAMAAQHFSNHINKNADAIKEAIGGGVASTGSRAKANRAKQLAKQNGEVFESKSKRAKMEKKEKRAKEMQARAAAGKAGKAKKSPAKSGGDGSAVEESLEGGDGATRDAQAAAEGAEWGDAPVHIEEEEEEEEEPTPEMIEAESLGPLVNPASMDLDETVDEDVDVAGADMESEFERERMLINGPLSKDAHARGLWREQTAKSKTESAIAFALFCLTEAARNALPDLEEQVDNAAAFISGRRKDGEESRTPVVRVRSVPTEDMVWARIRGFPWWPARLHTARDPKFMAALEKRGELLLVFVGEGGQYHVPKNSVAPFTGTEDDPHMPKAGKQAQIGLLRAIKTTQAILTRGAAVVTDSSDAMDVAEPAHGKGLPPPPPPPPPAEE